MNKILTRAITGSIYVALLVAATICGHSAFIAVFGILVIFGVWEISNLCNQSGDKNNLLVLVIDICGGLCIFISSFLNATSANSPFSPAHCDCHIRNHPLYFATVHARKRNLSIITFMLENSACRFSVVLAKLHTCRTPRTYDRIGMLDIYLD